MPIIDLLKYLKDCPNRIARRNWITRQLDAQKIPYIIENFQPDGANIIIQKSEKNKIIFSAHYDGNDLNDNLSSGAILLEILRNYRNDGYAMLLTDLEEERSRGMDAYIDQHGTDLPLIVLELCGSGNIVHLGELSFIPWPPFEEVSMDNDILTNLESCTSDLGFAYRRHITPPGDHLHYAMRGGKVGLLSNINEVDFEVINRMRTQTPPNRLFDGVDRNASVISRIPPFGGCTWENIQPTSLEKIYEIVKCYLNTKL